MGYLNAPDKTQEAIDEDGWLHSGDLGKHDEGGFLFITGRIKGIPWIPPSGDSLHQPSSVDRFNLDTGHLFFCRADHHSGR